MLVGLLLSDGHISKRGLNQNARFHFSQSGKTEKTEFFNKVLESLISLCTKEYKPYSSEIKDNKTNKVYNQITLVTMQLPCLNVLHNAFYKSVNLNLPSSAYGLHSESKGILRYKKIVPSNISDLLTYEALAY